MRKLLLAVLVLFLVPGALFAAPPNVLIILADDMGWSDIGCYGSEIETPNLDALAKGGLRFTQFYNTARCCPTRAALLTGLYPHQAGIGHMVASDGLPAYQGFLNDRCVTLAEALQPAGYTTLTAGKWHVGSAPGQWPLDRGFDRFWEHEGNKAVRQGDWKAVAKGRGAWELYDLKTDRTETHDLAARHPDKARELAARWQSWATRAGVWEWDDLQKHRQSRSKKMNKQ